jgi:hypothetical protein
VTRPKRHPGGRPARDPSGKPAADLLRIRVTGAEKAAYEQAAKDAKVSEWTRAALNAAAGRKAS